MPRRPRFSIEAVSPEVVSQMLQRPHVTVHYNGEEYTMIARKPLTAPGAIQRLVEYQLLDMIPHHTLIKNGVMRVFNDQFLLYTDDLTLGLENADGVKAISLDPSDPAIAPQLATTGSVELWLKSVAVTSHLDS